MTKRLAWPLSCLRERATRKPNAIDFWRGFALVNIFLSHMPGNTFERLSHRHYSLSDAELFVFLAGWALRLSSGRDHKASVVDIVKRAASRVVKLYKVQTATTACALLIMVAAAWIFEDRTIAHLGHPAAIRIDIVRSWLGLLLVTDHLQYFDILPLYLMLSVMSPAIILLHRRSPWLVLFASVATWVVASVLRFDLPTWPVEGIWFFDPLSWQLAFVLGFVFAGEGAPTRIVRRWMPKLFWPSLSIAVAGGVVVALHLTPDACAIDRSFASLLFSKTFIGPARLIHFLAMIVACSRIYPLVERHVASLARSLSLIGRHALPVFVGASLLSLLGRILLKVGARGIVPSFAVAATGLTIIVATAWMNEWRRIKRPKSVLPSSSRQLVSPSA